jgi:cytochrome c-type biogenesis protein
MAGTLLAAFGAGILSLLSPCVLPILPILVAGATAEGRGGLAALAGGLAISFAGAGIALATVGFSLGVDGGSVRMAAGALMVLLGAAIAIPPLRLRVGAFLAPATGLAGRGLARLDGRGAAGQFAIGLLLGVAWSPCVGPTLGAASLLAARGEHLGAVALTMVAFAIGAALPLLLVGAIPASRLASARVWLGAAGRAGGTLLGAGLVLAGALVLTGLDKRLEAWMLDAVPDWLVRLSTSL